MVHKIVFDSEYTLHNPEKPSKMVDKRPGSPGN